MTKLFDAFRLAFDSLVRTYTPQILATIVGWLVAANVAVTPEVQAFLGLLVAFIFFILWYLINRLYEVITGKVSKLLTFGLVAGKPVTYSALSPTELFADEQAAIAREAIARGE